MILEEVSTMSVDPAAQSRKAQTQMLFNTVARTYDTVGPAGFAHFGKELVDFVAVNPGQRVLDVATGRGAVLLPAAERAGASGEAVGIDLAESMVEATSAEIARRGLNARVLQMDAEQLDFPDASFDRVFCGFGVMFLPSQDKAVAGFRRVLKPGGRVGISTWKVTQIEDLGAVMESLGWSGERAPGWITDVERLTQLLESGGFSKVQAVESSTTLVYATFDDYWQTAMSTGRRRNLANLDEAETQRVKDAAAERLQDRLKPDGYHLTAVALLAKGERAD
jgi:ubiquinone/menaquinone biosynthesis C-methylase UbiE